MHLEKFGVSQYIIPDLLLAKVDADWLEVARVVCRPRIEDAKVLAISSTATKSKAKRVDGLVFIFIYR
jgi:hypothetical protein